MDDTKKVSHYQPDIQGLRAVAVSLVLIYHSGLPGLPGGYIGVDIFFVISGYLITGLLLREYARDHSISLARFYARRFRRLLPAATVVLVATIIAAWMIYSPLEIKQFLTSAFATAAYISNLWFAHLSTDYLAEDTGANPLLHTWSLGVEEQFYLVWPLLLLFVARRSHSADIYRRLLVAFSALALLSFVAAIWLTERNQPWAFFSSPTRAWEFAVGGLTAIYFARGRLLSTRTAYTIGWLGFSLIAFGAVVFERSTPFPGFAALVPVAGTMLIIAAAHTDKLRGFNALIATRPMQFVGDLSYSLYLWHWPVFVLFLSAALQDDPVLSIAGIAIVFALAWLTLVAVENPIRFNRRLSATTRSSLVLGMTLTFSSATLAFVLRGLAADALTEPEQQLFLKAKTDNPQIYEDGCHLDQFGTTPTDCRYGDKASDTVAILFGDSHAAHWFPAVERLAQENHWQLSPMTKSGCPSAVYEPFNPQLGRQYEECTLWQKNVAEEIARIHPELVIVSNSRTHASVSGYAEWRIAMKALFERIAPHARQVVVIRDTPRLSYNAPECLSRALWKDEDPEKQCIIDTEKMIKDPLYEAEKAAAVAFPNVEIVDLTTAICSESPCPVYADSTVKMVDHHHLTTQFARSLTPELRRAVGSASAKNPASTSLGETGR